MNSDQIEVTRDCEVVEIPGGQTHHLKKGTAVSITQALGESYTLMVPSHGGLFRLAGRDADAIGKENPEESAKMAPRAYPWIPSSSKRKSGRSSRRVSIPKYRSTSSTSG